AMPASGNGPSATVTLSRENFTRAPLELGCSPERSISTPAFASSSLYFIMAEMSFSSGITPDSESLVALTIIRNRIALFLADLPPQITPAPCRLYPQDEWEPCAPTAQPKFFVAVMCVLVAPCTARPLARRRADWHGAATMAMAGEETMAQSSTASTGLPL